MEEFAKLQSFNLKSLQHEFSENKPFQHIVLKNFFINSKLKDVLSAFQHLEFKEKNSDLFQFSQSKDFKSMANPTLKSFYDFFKSAEFLKFVSTITKTKVTSIDMSAFVYKSTDYLLPHDDQLEGRKIAYIVNLSDFNETDGGALELFETKDNHPTKVAKSYFPTFNSFVLFKVTPKSFHQVQEVLSDKQRCTITGWFHG